MDFKIPLRGISVNDVWQGKRFKTKLYKQFEIDCAKVIRMGKYPKKDKTELIVIYKFYIVNYGACDVGNFEKPLSDVLVKRGYYADDRYIKTIILDKERVKTKAEERIEVHIRPFNLEGFQQIQKIILDTPKL